MSSVELVAAAVAEMEQNDINAQNTESMWMLGVMGAYPGLQIAIQALLGTDWGNYIGDKLSLDPGTATGQASADYEEYTIDQGAGENETNNVNNIITDGKSAVQAIGDLMQDVFSMEQPFTQLLKALINIIMGFKT